MTLTGVRSASTSVQYWVSSIKSLKHLIDIQYFFSVIKLSWTFCLEIIVCKDIKNMYKNINN